MEGKNTTERRKFLRVPFETEAVIKDLESGRTVVSGRSKDISLKGMYCFTSEPLPANAPCSIELRLTGTSSKLWLHMEGRVVRTDAQGMAVSFDSMDLDVFIHLKNILYYNSGDPETIDRQIREFETGLPLEKE